MKIKNKIFSWIIVLWIFLAFFSLVYNLGKTYFEIKEWASLSDSEKRYKIFGDVYDFNIFLNNNTNKNAYILLYSQDTIAYYLGRYLIYPKKIVNKTNKNEFLNLVKKKSYTYVATYNTDVPFEGYIKVASFSSKTLKNFGGLYKRK